MHDLKVTAKMPQIARYANQLIWQMLIENTSSWTVRQSAPSPTLRVNSEDVQPPEYQALSSHFRGMCGAGAESRLAGDATVFFKDRKDQKNHCIPLHLDFFEVQPDPHFVITLGKEYIL